MATIDRYTTLQMTLFTIGYEGLSQREFFAILQSQGIETLVDVRELPLSRKAGFSKATLSDACALHEIRYLHLPSLGCPRSIRHQYRADGDWARYTSHFLQYLDTRTEAVSALAALALGSRCCLMCFEADAEYCHRSFVADRVQSFDARISVVHLTKTAASALVRSA